MAKPIRLLLPVLAAGALVAVISGCGSSLSGDAVAQVGNQTINNTDFQHRVLVTYLGSASQTGAPNSAAALPDPPTYANCIAARKKAAGKPKKGQPIVTDATYKAQCKAEDSQLRQSVLQTLIQQDWIIGESKDEGLSVTPKTVEAKFQQLKKQEFPKNSAYVAFLKSSHLTKNDLLQNVALTLLTDKLKAKITAKSPPVTKAEIAKYYAKNKATFGVPEKRNVRIVLNKSKTKVAAAIAALNAGQSWTTVAKKYSTDPSSKDNGGQLQAVTKGQEEPGLDQVIFAPTTKKSVIVGPVKTTFGYYAVELTGVTPGVQQTVGQATPQIKQILVAQNQQTALNSFVTRFTKKWTKLTSCRAGYNIVSVCHNYKAPKTTATPATATPGTEPAAPTSTG